MKIHSETHVITDAVTHTAVPICRPLLIRQGAIAIESVIWSIDQLGVTVDAWHSLALTVNPDWERDLVGIGPFQEGQIGHCYWNTQINNAYGMERDCLTKQIFLHNLLLPGRIRWISLKNYATPETAGVEVYYHEVDMGRQELDILNRKFGRYRR